MKRAIIAITVVAAASFNAFAGVELLYQFNSDTNAFVNVTWSGTDPVGWGAGTVKQTHTAGGWQMMMQKEFDYLPGGGSADQQITMQNAAYYGTDAHIAFDVMVDGTSFGPDEGWYQLNMVGNSDGTATWTQTDKLVDTWQNAAQSDLRAWHFDYTFPQLGWEGGDTWFQFHLGSNSENTKPVNFYIDNVVIYTESVPEPSTFALAGLGVAALLTLRRRR